MPGRVDIPGPGQPNSGSKEFHIEIKSPEVILVGALRSSNWPAN